MASTAHWAIALGRRLLGSSVLSGLCALPALAQEARPSLLPEPAADDAAMILVTAQKVMQRAIDVPVTLSVQSGADMRALGITDISALSAYVPGLNIQVQSANNPGFVIRGITSDSPSSQHPPRVTVYYNGVDISHSRGAYQGLYDLERVEVIKGPQATLFGTASTIGAIHLVSSKPEAGTSAQWTGAYGNLDAQRVEGFVNLGNDIIAARLAGQWQKRDGYITNLAPDQDDLYAQNQLGLRGSLRFTPSSDVTADLVLTYDRQRHSGTPFISRNLGSTAQEGLYAPAYLGGSPLSTTILGHNKLGLTRNVYDANLTIQWDFAPGWTFTTVNGYRQFDSLEVFDADGSAAWFLEFAEHAKGWKASHEGRFTYRDAAWRATFGWNFDIGKNQEGIPFSTELGTFLQCYAGVIPQLGCVLPDNTVPASLATGLLTGGAFSQIPYNSWYANSARNRSWSLFADATYSLSPSLELTAGARILMETRRSGFAAEQPIALILGTSLLPIADTQGQWHHATRSAAAILPRVNALLRLTPQLNAYATISKGRRSPVVEMTSQNGVVTENRLRAENVWNYEVGLKGQSGPLSGSLGFYYNTYRHFQIPILDMNGSHTESAGSARNWGLEGDVQARISQDLTAFANLGYISGGIDNKTANGIYAGDQFRLQPKWQAAGGFHLKTPLTPHTLAFLNPSVTYRSKLYFENPNTALLSQKGVTLAHVRGGVSWADARFEVAGFGRNLGQRKYLLDAGNTGASFGYPTFIPAEPRTYGIEVTARY